MILQKIKNFAKIATFALVALAGTLGIYFAGTPDCFAAKHQKSQKISKKQQREQEKLQKAKRAKLDEIEKIKLPPSAPNDSQPYALNVVYFIPQGSQPFPNYEKRLSEVLLYMQAWYLQQMRDRGFGERTFGLSKSPDGQRVNILIVPGKFGKERYDGNSAIVVHGEVEQWFNKNPDKKLSQHSLILLPSTSGNPKSPGGVPFHGFGKECFALDFENLDHKYCGAAGDMGWLYTVWAGGMAHELAHGLGIAHVRGRVSEDGPRGTELMNAGNSTWGAQPTFLTESSCAILDGCQVFQSKEWKRVPHEGVKRTIIRFKYKTKSGTKEKPDSELESVLVAGEMPKGHHAKHLAVFYDKDEVGIYYQDYDAESFMAEWNDDRTKFKVTIPMDEIHPGKTDKYQIRIVPIYEDGEIAHNDYNFTRGKEEDFDSSGKVWEPSEKKKGGNGGNAKNKKSGGNAKK